MQECVLVHCLDAVPDQTGTRPSSEAALKTGTDDLSGSRLDSASTARGRRIGAESSDSPPFPVSGSPWSDVAVSQSTYRFPHRVGCLAPVWDVPAASQLFVFGPIWYCFQGFLRIYSSLLLAREQILTASLSTFLLPGPLSNPQPSRNIVYRE